mgnify:CR=1 FL=1
MRMPTAAEGVVEQRGSEKRIAVNVNLRASDSKKGTLDPAFEASDESGASNGDDDPFDRMISERGKS